MPFTPTTRTTLGFLTLLSINGIATSFNVSSIFFAENVLTSSGLTEEWSEISPNRHRVGPAFAEANFGLIQIDWTQMPPALDMEIRSVAGEALISRELRF